MYNRFAVAPCSFSFVRMCGSEKNRVDLDDSNQCTLFVHRRETTWCYRKPNTHLLLSPCKLSNLILVGGVVFFFPFFSEESRNRLDLGQSGPETAKRACRIIHEADCASTVEELLYVVGG